MNQINCLNWAMFIIRVLLGGTFIMHGSQKVFGLFGGPGLGGWLGYMSSMNIPTWLAHIPPYFELIGGILILLGIAAELGAVMTACVMIGALVLVHGRNGFFLPNGFEYALNLLLLSVAIIIGGPGKFALWDVFKNWRM